MHTPPAGFRHCTPIMIRFVDMDAMGHVNNANYLTYMETARMAYIQEVCQIDSVLNTGMILAKITVDYRQPLVMGDDIAVYTRCTRLSHRSFDLEAVIMRYKGEQQSEVAASGLAVLVAYDYQAEHSMPLPGEWRERITAHEGTDLG